VRYSVLLSPGAERDLGALDNPVQRRVVAKIITEEQRSWTGWIGCQVLVEILADGTRALNGLKQQSLRDVGAHLGRRVACPVSGSVRRVRQAASVGGLRERARPATREPHALCHTLSASRVPHTNTLTLSLTRAVQSPDIPPHSTRSVL
jgi:hypothetical protein